MWVWIYLPNSPALGLALSFLVLWFFVALTRAVISTFLG